MSSLGSISYNTPIGQVKLVAAPTMSAAQLAGLQHVDVDKMWIEKDGQTYWFKSEAGVTEYRPVVNPSTVDPENPPSSIFTIPVTMDDRLTRLTRDLNASQKQDLRMCLSALWNLSKHASDQG